MRADPGERIAPEKNSGPRQLPILLVLVALALVIGLLVYLREPKPEPNVPAPAPPAVEKPVEVPDPPPPATAPDIPQRELVPPSPATEQPDGLPAPPPLTLEDSDSEVSEALEQMIRSERLRPLVEADNLLSRAVAVIDGAARGIIPYKLLPLSPPSERFPVTEMGRQTYMSPEGYVRYDSLASAVADVDAEALVQAFHRYRPLLEEAYALLGYEAADFDNTLMQALDTLIAAPVIRRPLELRKVEAVYRFEDPALERAPEIHRQLLRMGPDNTGIVQAKARELRALLLAE
ncbi:MAG: DUF3014 domain-containing protein [Halieaceae bacterium]|jgi:hypothetical protein|nr:DUF3014 domain-containing protein [Halieaceae bacterium]